MKIKHIVFDEHGDAIASAEGSVSGDVTVHCTSSLTMSPDEADCLASIIERAAEDARVLRKDEKPL